MTRPLSVLMDERCRPGLREQIGALLARARSADFAVARIRLGMLDLSEEETSGVRRCRVLLGQLDAASLLDITESGQRSARAAAMGRLLGLARSGRLEVRSAGLATWTPDFALLRSVDSFVGLVGAIYFANPQPVAGASLTLVTTDPLAMAMLAERFEELWARSHDVLPAIRHVLEEAHAMVGEAGPRGGRPDPARALR